MYLNLPETVTVSRGPREKRKNRVQLSAKQAA